MSEELLLGAVLYRPDLLPVARRTVTADMFDRDAHRTVWTTCCTMADEGIAANVVEVLSRLARDGKLDQIGGPGPLHELVSATQPSHIEHYAQRVVEDHRGRLLWRACDDAQRRLTANDAVDQVLAELSQSPGHARGKGTFKPSDLLAALRLRMAGGADTWSTGWPTLDEVWRPAPGTLTIVTGTPGAGKSTLLDAVLLRQVVQGRKVAVWSPEQAPAEHHLGRLVWSWGGRPPESLPDGELDGVVAGWDGVLSILDPDDATLDSVLARAAALRPDVLVIDPWNNLSHTYGDRQDLYIQQALGRLVRFARSSGCAVWVVAHPTKMHVQPGTQSVFVPPTLYDISGGAEWANKADVVVCVWRDIAGERDRASQVRIIVQKVRREEWGHPGMRRLEFSPASRGYSESRFTQQPVPV